MVAAYVWDYAGQMQMLRFFWEAARALDPVARELDEGKRFPLCQPEPLAALFVNAGLQGVEVRVQAGLPIRADGSISLVARAWAVRGRV